jgi:hypothetical protein
MAKMETAQLFQRHEMWYSRHFAAWNQYAYQIASSFDTRSVAAPWAASFQQHIFGTATDRNASMSTVVVKSSTKLCSYLDGQGHNSTTGTCGCTCSWLYSTPQHQNQITTFN